MYDLFISYRRDGGHEMARLLYEHLKLKGLNCFFDLEELGSGQFNIKLLRCIEESDNFVLILSPNALERCKNSMCMGLFAISLSTFFRLILPFLSSSIF